MRRGGLAIGCVSAEVPACCALAPRQLLPRVDSSAKPPCRAVPITRWKREQRSNDCAALYLDPRPVRRDADERLRGPRVRMTCPWTGSGTAIAFVGPWKAEAAPDGFQSSSTRCYVCRPRKAPAAVQDVASTAPQPSRAIGGRSGAFAKPWKCGTRPVRIEATRCGSYASVGGLRAGPGVDRVAAIIQGDAVSSSDRGGRYRFSSKRLVWCAAKRAARRRPLPVDTLARFLGSKTKI